MAKIRPTMIDDTRMNALVQTVKETCHLPGCLAEVGVCNGGSALKMLRASKGKKKIHLFDTFEGLPSAEGTYLRVGEFKGNLVYAQRLLSRFDTEFHVGFFPATTVELKEDVRFCCVHLDGDLYQTTMDGLIYFWPKMVEGGVIVFDDYGWPSCPGVKKAIEEFFGTTDAVIKTPNCCQCKIVKTAIQMEKPWYNEEPKAEEPKPEPEPPKVAQKKQDASVWWVK